MTHRQRVLADRLVALPLEFAFNGLARALGATLRRDHTMSPGNVRRVAVAKLVGLGSIVQATPLIRQLRLRYPHARVTLVTLAANRDLVPCLPGVDDAIFLDDAGVVRMAVSTARAVVALIRQRVDLYFDLELYSAFASLLALWAVARNRVGFYRRSTQYKNGTYTHLVYFNNRMPVRQLYLQLGRVVGAPHLADESVGPLRVEDDARVAAAAAVPPGPFIVVNPNASPLLLERRWPAEHVVAAVERLTGLGHHVVFIGSGSERPYVTGLCDRLSPAARSAVTNTAGLLPLQQTLAVLERAAVVLTNDTGPMHLAVALGRPTVCLFGPVHPEHYGHPANHVITLYAPVICSPCVHEIDAPPCNGNNVCMQRLTPDLVVSAVLDLLDPARQRWAVHLPVVSDDAQGQPLGLVVRASMAARQLVIHDS
jgi:ADP-heptose:LPS heptosyltransferase